MLGAGARLEPGDQQGFDLRVRGTWMLAAELSAADGLAKLVQVERRPQPCREHFRGIIRHGVIVAGAHLDGIALGSAVWRLRLEKPH